jgi:hypothetical protein
MATDEYPLALVVKAYTPEPGPPVQLQAGDIVYIGEESPVYPRWVRARVPDGRKTWIPEAYVRGEDGEEGLALVDYDSRELKVEGGEIVRMLLEVWGWVWVRTEDGREGWLPMKTLVPPTVVSPILT